jgi:hypothetical protein
MKVSLKLQTDSMQPAYITDWPRYMQRESHARVGSGGGGHTQLVWLDIVSGCNQQRRGSTPAVLCCAVLCCAVLCCAVLCCAVLCCAVLCCAVLCCACVTATNACCVAQPHGRVRVRNGYVGSGSEFRHETVRAKPTLKLAVSIFVTLALCVLCTGT